ncbi:MAG TPA: hypothetical protein P5079_01090 [Elusimicrobiota bacterium]|nr:hypothetical protein [Elusimicrobiota bacterium]
MKKLFSKTAGFSSRSWTSPLLAAAFLPLLAAALWTTWRLLCELAGKRLPLTPVLAGAGGYVLLHLLFQKPMRLYVFGHELTHALAAWLSGFRVKSMKVSAKGGEVSLSDSNLLVALSPYCVPFYTLTALGLFEVSRRFVGFAVPPFWYAFTIGLTFSFHAALTGHALLQNQPDLRYAGTFFSLVLILFSNVLVFVLLLKILFPANVPLKPLAAHFVSATLIILDRLAQFAVWAGVKGWTFSKTLFGKVGPLALKFKNP